MKHLFYSHSNMDIIVKYDKKLESLASRTLYTRIRNSVFTKIMSGEFNEELEKILSINFEFKLHELTFFYPLSCDIDSCNKKQREILYHKKIDVLLKLGTN